jgi:hypothetical protein
MQKNVDNISVEDIISHNVESYLAKHVNDHNVSNIDSEYVSNLINKLRHNASTGGDGITAEHLQQGKSEILCTHLASLFNTIISHSCLPSYFCHGVIVPILKKPTLSPNQPENYRPITISTVLSKLLEFMLIPQAEISESQFGFREGRGTSFGCRFMSDIISHFKHQGSLIYICSLDAEKCFDSICHTSLFHKLIDIIPSSHWVLCYKWYCNLQATVKWQNNFSAYFRVCKVSDKAIFCLHFFLIFLTMICF